VGPSGHEKRSTRKRLIVIIAVGVVLFAAVPLWFKHAQDVADQRARSASDEISSNLQTVSLDQLWQAEVTSATSGDSRSVFEALPHPSRAAQTGAVSIDKNRATFSYQVSYAGSTACVNVEMTVEATIVEPGRCPE